MNRRFVLLLAGLCLHVTLQLAPAWSVVHDTPNGRDFASYYYAVKVAAAGGDPYNKAALARMSRAEDTRSSVHPYFYPPPFLLSMVWALPFSLASAYKGMLILNELLLGACLLLLRKHFGITLCVVVLLLGAFTPIPDNAWMGQANLVALLPALLGLSIAEKRPIGGGILVGIAAMCKMSPALFLLYWALRRRWTAVFAAMGTAVGLSLLALPLVPLSTQLGFYRDVLPGFAAGDYHGLTIPISLAANHSIPDLWNRLWPHPLGIETRLSDAAQVASKATALLLLGVWGWRFRRPGGPVAEAAALAALTVLMVVVPAYTYEHHLVFLLLPVALAGSFAPLWAFIPMFFFLAWPLDWLRAAGKSVPALAGFFRESKFFAEVGLFAICLWLGGRKTAPPVEAPDRKKDGAERGGPSDETPLSAP